jgi:hypothetical protein
MGLLKVIKLGELQMAVVESKLGHPRAFNSFFGPVNFEPGLNRDIHDRLWKNLKMNNLDVQALLEKGLLVEIIEISDAPV